MKTPLTAVVLAVLLVLVLANPLPAQAGSVIPTFTIVNIVPDTSVTILTYNFPANRSFDVLMGPISTRGVGGIKVSTINSGAGGSFSATFNIPLALGGQYQIAIRLESTSGSGYYAYNWFYNNRFGSLPTVPPPADAKPLPAIFITGVVQDVSVTISTQNFPANDRFDVLMGYMGSRGIGGIPVANVSTGAGGKLSFTFSIPQALRGQPQIAIRLQSATGSEYYAYSWFVNNTSGSTGWPVPSPHPGYSGFPTFAITQVVRDQTVSIITHNLPPKEQFQVLMGPMGTRGINGIVVGTIDTSVNNAQTFTLAIPVALYGSNQIAIRLQSISGAPYYAYNWFYNVTTP
jgi:spore coat protein U-like protein